MAGDPKTLSKRIVGPIPVLTIANKKTDSWSRRELFPFQFWKLNKAGTSSHSKLFIVRRGRKSSLKKRETKDDRGRYSVQKRYGSQNSFSPKLTRDRSKYCALTTAFV
jgi:hypothetical protein